MFKETLRIIYWDDDGFKPVKVLDVIDFGDRFVKDNEKKDFYGGIHLKKEYLHWTIATPEKEEMLKEYYEKCKELDEFRIKTQKFIFR